MVRDERAVDETKAAYGKRLRGLAFNLLRDERDAEECENDTYMKAWSAIPPARPTLFFAYLARICRNLAFNRLESLKAAKRDAASVELSSELEACIPDPASRRDFEERELAEIINGFLGTLSKESRVIFLRRYFSAMQVSEIAKTLGVSQALVKSSLFRTRKKLKEYLEKEGISV